MPGNVCRDDTTIGTRGVFRGLLEIGGPTVFLLNMGRIVTVCGSKGPLWAVLVNRGGSGWLPKVVGLGRPWPGRTVE